MRFKKKVIDVFLLVKVLLIYNVQTTNLALVNKIWDM